MSIDIATAVNQSVSLAPQTQAARQVQAPSRSEAVAPEPKETLELDLQDFDVSKETMQKALTYRVQSRTDEIRSQFEHSSSSSSTPLLTLLRGQRDAVDETPSAMVEPSAGCETCKTRQYQDGSNDGGVSFQAAQRIPTATAAVTVMAHEGEHVNRESARAREEGQIVTHQKVTMQMAMCPECSRMYVAGGKTTMQMTPQAEDAPHVEVNSMQDLIGGVGEEVDVYV